MSRTRKWGSIAKICFIALTRGIHIMKIFKMVDVQKLDITALALHWLGTWRVHFNDESCRGHSHRSYQMSHYLSLWFSCPRFSRGYHARWRVRHLLPKCVIAHVSWGGLHLLPKWRPTCAQKIADTILDEWDIWYNVSSVLAANITSAVITVTPSNQRFFLKFEKHAQSVRCIFCNYCANILCFCFLRCVFLLRWPIIWTCGI
jgi:hypothetical protein